MDDLQFPQYVCGGLYLAAKRNNTATYHRPNLTGHWDLEAQFINNQLVCTDCVGTHLIGVVLTPITKEQFLEENGGCYTLKQLIK